MGTKINTINLDSKYINSLKYDEIIKGFNNPNITEFSFSCIEVFHEFLYMFQDEAKDLAKIKYLTFNGYFSDINDFYLIDQTKELFRKFLTGIKAAKKEKVSGEADS